MLALQVHILVVLETTVEHFILSVIFPIEFRVHQVDIPLENHKLSEVVIIVFMQGPLISLFNSLIL